MVQEDLVVLVVQRVPKNWDPKITLIIMHFFPFSLTVIAFHDDCCFVIIILSASMLFT